MCLLHKEPVLFFIVTSHPHIFLCKKKIWRERKREREKVTLREKHSGPARIPELALAWAGSQRGPVSLFVGQGMLLRHGTRISIG